MSIGLQKLADCIQRLGQTVSREPLGPRLDDLPRFRRYDKRTFFHLTDLERTRRNEATAHDVDACFGDKSLLEVIARRLENHRWVWIQRGRHQHENYERSVWVWDACAGHRLEFKDRILLVCVDRSRDDAFPWQFILEQLPSSPDRKHDSQHSTGSAIQHLQHLLGRVCRSVRTMLRPEQPLETSLITSFLPTRTSLTKHFWPPPTNGSVVGCEFYGFMLPDLRWLQRWAREPELPENSLHHALAWLSNKPAALGRVAERMNQHFPLDKRPIVAFASYIPEVSNLPGSDSSELAVGSLRCLAQLALLLKKNHNHPISVIELVGGSRVMGLDWRALVELLANDTDPTLAVTLEDPQVTRRYLVQALDRAVNGLVNELKDARITLAVELEPGQLYALNDLDSVDHLLRLGAELPLDPVLGINIGAVRK